MARIYIAGPIAGRALQEYTTAFRYAGACLTELGWEPVCPLDVEPHQHDGDCPPGPAAGETEPGAPTHTAPCYMRSDLGALLTCDAIYLLDGWEYSSGARTEFEVARAAGLAIHYQWYETTLGGAS